MELRREGSLSEGEEVAPLGEIGQAGRKSPCSC